jgi:excisionase family DNA binding protein
MTAARDDWRMDAETRALLDGETLRADKLLTAADLADRWGVPQGQVYRLARDGRLGSVRLGRYRRFSLLAIQEFEKSGGTE